MEEDGATAEQHICSSDRIPAADRPGGSRLCQAEKGTRSPRGRSFGNWAGAQPERQPGDHSQVPLILWDSPALWGRCLSGVFREGAHPLLGTVGKTVTKYQGGAKPLAHCFHMVRGNFFFFNAK